MDTATPLLPRSQSTSVIELGQFGSAGVTVGVGAPTATVYVGLTDSSGTAGGSLTRDDIRPLLFGAAWKVLDQVCELALEQAGIQHDAKWRYSIELKVKHASNWKLQLWSPFDARLVRQPPFGL